MRKYLVLGVISVFIISAFGCAKKEPVEEQTETMSMESLSTINAETQGLPAPQAKAIETMPQTAAPDAIVAQNLGALPPGGPYKPTVEEIQTALKNAGLYTGAIDGKMGPMTKKAVEEFQNASGLTADGKVGPKTWEALSKHLQPAVSTTVPAKKR